MWSKWYSVRIKLFSEDYESVVRLFFSFGHISLNQKQIKGDNRESMKIIPWLRIKKGLLKSWGYIFLLLFISWHAFFFFTFTLLQIMKNSTFVSPSTDVMKMWMSVTGTVVETEESASTHSGHTIVIVQTDMRVSFVMNRPLMMTHR